MDELVSVIIPVYNVEKYLDACVESVLRQTYKNLEIILVDDGSTDNSGKICDKYKLIDNRVKVIHKENGGLSSARNAGLDICKGEFISFIDSDDFVSDKFIELLYRTAKKENVLISAVRKGVDFWDGDDNTVSFYHENIDELNIETVSIRKALELMMYMKVTTGYPWRLYNKLLFKNFRLPDGIYYEDLASTYKVMMQTDKIAYIDAGIYAYRKRANSIIRESFSMKKMVIVDITRELFENITDYDESLKYAAANRCFSALFNVYLQIPLNNKNSLIVWNEIKKYRQMVIQDRSKLIRKKNKYGVYASYLPKCILFSLVKVSRCFL